MIINKCKTVNSTIIKKGEKGSPDTTCSEFVFSWKLEIFLKKNFLRANSQIDKTYPSDPLKSEKYWPDTLKNLALNDPNISESL